MMKRALVALWLLVLGCTRPRFEPPMDAAAEPDADAATTGACVSLPPEGAETCFEVPRESCPINADRDRAFYGEGSRCPNEDAHYSLAGQTDCNGDVNDDGRTDVRDTAAVMNCLALDVQCARADINNDGRVDPWDVCISSCLTAGRPDCCAGPGCGACLNGEASLPCTLEDQTRCEGLGGTGWELDLLCPECTCEADVDGDGRELLEADLARLNDCIANAATTLALCERADINCDGRVSNRDRVTYDCRMADGGSECCFRVD